MSISSVTDASKISSLAGATTRSIEPREARAREVHHQAPVLPRFGDFDGDRFGAIRDRVRQTLDRSEHRDDLFNWLRGRGGPDHGLPDWGRGGRGPTVQPMYGVTLRPEDPRDPPRVQPMYGVTIRPDDPRDPPRVQPMYGVTIRPADQGRIG